VTADDVRVAVADCALVAALYDVLAPVPVARLYAPEIALLMLTAPTPAAVVFAAGAVVVLVAKADAEIRVSTRAVAVIFFMFTLLVVV
jgi:hypothetical protein